MEKYPIQNERMFLRSPCINICFRIIIEGIIEKNIIEEAIKNIGIRHPFIKCSVEIDKDNNSWLIQKNGSSSIEYYKSNEMEWQNWFIKNDNIPFNLSNETLLKYCVITGVNTEIIILGHHIIGDGIGYFNLIKDFLQALDGNVDLTPLIPPFKKEELKFKKTVPLNFMVKLFSKSLNNKWKKSRIKFSENEYLDFFDEYRKTKKPNVYLFSIDKEKLEKILEKCKINGLTVNELISSAFSVVLMEHFKRNDFELGVAINIRNELVSEPNKSMGNYVSGINAKINYDLSNDFFSNAKTITSKLKEQLKNLKNRHMVVNFLKYFDSDLLESLVYAAYGNCNHPISKKLAELVGERAKNKGLGISNLGRHSFTEYKNIIVDNIQFIQPAFPKNILTIGVITVSDNKMNFCFRFNENEIKTEDIKIICKKGIELLV